MPQKLVFQTEQNVALTIGSGKITLIGWCLKSLGMGDIEKFDLPQFGSGLHYLADPVHQVRVAETDPVHEIHAGTIWIK